MLEAIWREAKSGWQVLRQEASKSAAAGGGGDGGGGASIVVRSMLRLLLIRKVAGGPRPGLWRTGVVQALTHSRQKWVLEST